MMMSSRPFLAALLLGMGSPLALAANTPAVPAPSNSLLENLLDDPMDSVRTFLSTERAVRGASRASLASWQARTLTQLATGNKEKKIEILEIFTNNVGLFSGFPEEPVPALSGMLADEDEDIRRHAKWALESLVEERSGKAIAGLKSRLADEEDSFWVRPEFLEARASSLSDEMLNGYFRSSRGESPGASVLENFFVPFSGRLADGFRWTRKVQVKALVHVDEEGDVHVIAALSERSWDGESHVRQDEDAEALAESVSEQNERFLAVRTPGNMRFYQFLSQLSWMSFHRHNRSDDKYSFERLTDKQYSGVRQRILDGLGNAVEKGNAAITATLSSGRLVDGEIAEGP